jgi:hypothetical protein
MDQATPTGIFQATTEQLKMSAEQAAQLAAIREYILIEDEQRSAHDAEIDKTNPVAYEAIQERADAALAAVSAIAKQLPEPTTTLGDVILRAGVAAAYADRDNDGGVESAEEHSAAALIRAVHEWAGITYQ